MHQVNLRRGDVLHLLLDGVNVVLPLGQQLVQLVPLLGPERSVHGGGHVDDTIVLGQLGSHQLGLDDVNEELLNLLLVDLYTALDLLECDLAPRQNSINSKQKD